MDIEILAKEYAKEVEVRLKKLEKVEKIFEEIKDIVDGIANIISNVNDREERKLLTTLVIMRIISKIGFDCSDVIGLLETMKLTIYMSHKILTEVATMHIDEKRKMKIMYM